MLERIKKYINRTVFDDMNELELNKTLDISIDTVLSGLQDVKVKGGTVRIGIQYGFVTEWVDLSSEEMIIVNEVFKNTLEFANYSLEFTAFNVGRCTFAWLSDKKFVIKVNNEIAFNKANTRPDASVIIEVGINATKSDYFISKQENLLS